MTSVKTGSWVVEVRKASPLDRESDDWLWLSTCPDADHNLMQSGVIASHLLQVRTRIAQVPDGGGGRDGDR